MWTRFLCVCVCVVWTYDASENVLGQQRRTKSIIAILLRVFGVALIVYTFYFLAFAVFYKKELLDLAFYR